MRIGGRWKYLVPDPRSGFGGVETISYSSQGWVWVIEGGWNYLVPEPRSGVGDCGIGVGGTVSYQSRHRMWRIGGGWYYLAPESRRDVGVARRVVLSRTQSKVGCVGLGLGGNISPPHPRPGDWRRVILSRKGRYLSYRGRNVCNHVTMITYNGDNIGRQVTDDIGHETGRLPGDYGIIAQACSIPVCKKQK